MYKTWKSVKPDWRVKLKVTEVRSCEGTRSLQSTTTCSPVPSTCTYKVHVYNKLWNLCSSSVKSSRFNNFIFFLDPPLNPFSLKIAGDWLPRPPPLPLTVAKAGYRRRPNQSRRRCGCPVNHRLHSETEGQTDIRGVRRQEDEAVRVLEEDTRHTEVLDRQPQIYPPHRGKTYDEEIIRLLPTGIGERCSQTIPNLWQEGWCRALAPMLTPV